MKQIGKQIKSLIDGSNPAPLPAINKGDIAKVLQIILYTKSE